MQGGIGRFIKEWQVEKKKLLIKDMSFNTIVTYHHLDPLETLRPKLIKKHTAYLG
jgi:hypothetical protein